MDFLLTVIICATDLVLAYEVCLNIEKTSGCKCLFLIHDNKSNLSIAKVYNMYARIAKADCILLAHQDIELIGDNWSSLILAKLNEKDCGAIGFAGSVIKPKDFYGGWPINARLARCNYSHKTRDNAHHEHVNDSFDQVCVLDGLAMFVRKDVLTSYPFDEHMLDGFHCYDLDFTLCLHCKGFKNYVVTDRRISVFHKSLGKHDLSWIKSTFKMMQQKWNVMLPVAVDEMQLNAKDIDDIKRENLMFIKLALQRCSIEDLEDILSKLPFKLEKDERPFMYNNGYEDWS